MRISDWSSDVCSSDLHADRGTADAVDGSRGHVHDDPLARTADGRSTRGPGEGGTWEPGVGVEPDRAVEDRNSVVEGKRVSVRVGLGGRRIFNKNNENTNS